VSLGDAIDHYTLEHFESGENRLPSSGLSDPRVLVTTASMIPREYIHLWNAKYRTPVGLDIKTHQDPMQARLIWVYEDLIHYISNIVAARSGFWSEDQLPQSLAIDAARLWDTSSNHNLGGRAINVHRSPPTVTPFTARI